MSLKILKNIKDEKTKKHYLGDIERCPLFLFKQFSK